MSSGSEQQQAAAGSSIDPDPSKEAEESSTSKKTYGKLKNKKLSKQEKDAWERKEAGRKEKREAEAAFNRMMDAGIIEAGHSSRLKRKGSIAVL